MVHPTPPGQTLLVLNPSVFYQGLCLNDQLALGPTPGPTLDPSLIGVLLGFRQYPVAVSGDIYGMKKFFRL